MNAVLSPPTFQVEPRRFRPPSAALDRFAQRLGRERAAGKVSEAAFTYAVDESRLDALVEGWCADADSGEALLELTTFPWFRLAGPDTELCFVHRPAAEREALPLLLLHGYWGSLTELSTLVEPLVSPADHGGTQSDAFAVVCPALPGFGITHAAGRTTARELGRACAKLMAQLGYERYVVHGSDLGACVAAEVAAQAPSHVAALHVTSLHAFPDESPEELAALSSVEKSQLALLTHEYEALAHELPESPIEDLAYALRQLDDWTAPVSEYAPLLRSLTAAWAFGDVTARRGLYASERLRPSPRFEVPVLLETHALDAPCLRRFVQRHYRVRSVVEQARGGRLPALEATSQLMASLRDGFRPFRATS